MALTYREIFMQILASAMVTWLEEGHDLKISPLIPPKRHNYKLVETIGKLYLPPSSSKVLEQLAGLYGYKAIEIAELLLQVVLNSIPIMEVVNENVIEPDVLINMLTDSVQFDTSVHTKHFSGENK